MGGPENNPNSGGEVVMAIQIGGGGALAGVNKEGIESRSCFGGGFWVLRIRRG